LFKAALDEFAAIGEPVNRVLEVDLDRDQVTLTRFAICLPASARPCFSILRFGVTT
jgi:hypothetical protein